jgi:hypothetical protein
LIEVGRIALENKDYKNAIPFFEQVVNDYKATPNYQLGRKFLIKAKEGMIKILSYPRNRNKISYH